LFGMHGERHSTAGERMMRVGLSEAWHVLAKIKKERRLTLVA